MARKTPKHAPAAEPDTRRRARGHFTFRVRDALRAELEAAAERNGRSVSEEIEQRLELASYLLDQAGPRAELADHLFLPHWIDFARRAVLEAGESADKWDDYTIPWNRAVDNAIGREQAFALVQAAVRRAYWDSKDFIAKHGEPPARDEARRRLPGTAGPEAALAMVIHREHVDRIRRIEANAPAWLALGRPQ